MFSSAEADPPAESAIIVDSRLLVSKKGTSQYGDISSCKKRGVKRKMPILIETRWNIVNVNEVAQLPHLKTRLFSW